MLHLLEHITQVLTNDSVLTALVPVASITPTYRRPSETDEAVEYSVSDQIRYPDGKNETTIRFYLHSRTSEARCWEIAEAIHPLMTAARLTKRIDPARNKPFVVLQCRQTQAYREPRNEWAATILVEYSLKVSELNPVHQNQ